MRVTCSIGAKRNTIFEHARHVGPRLRGDIGVFIRELRYFVLGMHSALYVGMLRTQVTDAVKDAGYDISFREFTNSQNEKMLAIDSANVYPVAMFVNNRFPRLQTDIISREPYAYGVRLIVKGF